MSSDDVRSAPALITERIHREGPIRFGAFVDLALYAAGGFFARGAGAGRSGQDFITSPEVGPLFGVCTARALDAEWVRQGRPDPFVVVEAGAGNGRLAREVLRAEPECATALHYVLVERSEVLREEQTARLPIEPRADMLGPGRIEAGEDAPVPVGGLGPIVSALDSLPARPVDGVIIANELLDNLAFEVVVRNAAGWSEVRVGLDEDRFVEMLVPAADDLAHWVADVDAPIGTRLPVATEVVGWMVDAAASLRRGAVILLDYVAPWAELVARDGGWLRTYAGHERGHDPLGAPGSRDITADVPLEMVLRAAGRAGLTPVENCSQAAWLRGLGIDDLVASGAARWAAAAASPDLAAIAGRSRGTEAAVLTASPGLGAHTVLTFSKP